MNWLDNSMPNNPRSSNKLPMNVSISEDLILDQSNIKIKGLGYGFNLERGWSWGPGKYKDGAQGSIKIECGRAEYRGRNTSIQSVLTMKYFNQRITYGNKRRDQTEGLAAQTTMPGYRVELLQPQSSRTHVHSHNKNITWLETYVEKIIPQNTHPCSSGLRFFSSFTILSIVLE